MNEQGYPDVLEKIDVFCKIALWRHKPWQSRLHKNYNSLFINNYLYFLPGRTK
jgi:hypothetical protein